MKLIGNNFTGNSNLPYKLKKEISNGYATIEMSLLRPDGEWQYFDQCIEVIGSDETSAEALKRCIIKSESYFGIKLIKEELQKS